MTPDRDITRLLDRWLADGPTAAHDRVLDAVADRIERQPQRPAWRLLWRYTHVNSTFRLIAAATAIIVVALVATGLVGRPSDAVIGGPSGSPSPSPISPSTTVPAPSSPSGTSYSTSKFEVPISFDLIYDIRVDSEESHGLGLVHPSMTIGLGSLASLQVAGPTDAATPQPWPRDLSAWLRDQLGLAPSDVVQTTVAGRPATAIDVDVTPTEGAQPQPIQWPGGGWTRMTFQERWRLVEIRTGSGEGLVAIMGANSLAFDDAAATFDRFLATLEFRDAPSP